MIKRKSFQTVIDKLKPRFVVGLFGARRTGKTVLMEEVRNTIGKEKVLFVQGDNLDASEVLSSQRVAVLERFVKGYTHLFIDEAQAIPNIGVNLKLIVDNIPDVSVFVTGSSAFDLKNKIGEPLTGRSRFFNLYPIAQSELNEDFIKSKENLEQRIIYGSYPQVINELTNVEKQNILEGIRDSYLLKDILVLDSLKNSQFILNLLRLIAFQIGNEISYSELGKNLNADFKTVKRYLELLEKTFVLFSLTGYSSNMRKEYSKSPRYYFWDNGIRNAVISNFNRLSLRDDLGRLWENYIISERLKRNHYSELYANYFFWRNYNQKEIDLIEERDGKLFGYEIKWKKDNYKIPKEFVNNYQNSVVEIITNENYMDFIC